MLEFVCQKDRAVFLRDKDNHLSPNELRRIRKIVEELKKYRPIQYILGETEFYGLKLIVNEQVLIPRPETEELVDEILHFLSAQRREKEGGVCLDIGTGSGCMAVSLAKNLPDFSVYALDISAQALEVARQNAKLHRVNIHFFQQDMMDEQALSSQALPRAWDLMVSNPPYVLPSEKNEMSPNVLNYEPHQDLFVPEEKPLLFYERIADLGLRYLKKNGLLFFEIPARGGEAIVRMLKNKGYETVELLKDISGKDRMVKACGLF